MFLSSPSVRETGRLRSRATRFTQTPLLCDFPVHPLRLSAQVDDMMHGGVCFDREGSLGTASRASPPRAGASPRRAGGTRAVDRGSRPLGRAGAAARPRHASARGHQLGTERPFVARSEASVNSSCRSPRPRPRAPHPRRTRTRRCPRRRRETWRPRRADARGVLKVRPHPPRPRRSPTRHPFIVGKEKNARPSGRHTAWSLPSDDPSHLKRTKRSSFSVLRSPFSAPRSSTRRSREATWAPRDRSPRTSTSSRSGRTPTPRGTGCGSTSAFQTRGPARRFFST